jgi:hypothetical protein
MRSGPGKNRYGSPWLDDPSADPLEHFSLKKQWALHRENSVKPKRKKG